MKYFLFLILFLVHNTILAQTQDETDVILEKYLENVETSGDFVQIQDELLIFLHKPLNLNTATVEDLMTFPLLSPSGAMALVNHRNKYNYFLHIAELQVVGFNAEEIKILSPYFTTEIPVRFKLIDYQQALNHGDLQCIYSLKFKSNQMVPDSSYGDLKSSNLRFRYQKTGYYSMGFTADKDPGEAWWQRGPDFYSAHLFLENLGKFKSIALGDYLLSFGQGLVMGSGIGMGKSAFVLNTKRNSNTLKPYRGINEFLYLRGAALTLKIKNWDVTIAASINKLDGRQSGDTNEFETFISLDLDGLHRNAYEMVLKNNLKRSMTGAWLHKRGKLGYWGMGANTFQYSRPMETSEVLYNQLEPTGNNSSFIHFFQAHTISRFHIFSEWAYLPQNQSKAAVVGLLTTLGKQAELSILWRHYDPGFSSPFSTAFGNSSQNESGFYTGIKINLTSKLVLANYLDVWKNPWLNYRVWAPALGKDIFWQLEYNPAKKSQLYIRYRNLDRPFPENTIEPVKTVIQHQIHNFRIHVQNKISKTVTFQLRGEVSNSVIKGIRRQSSLVFMQFNKTLNNTKFIVRHTIFNAPFYYNRLFAFESQLTGDFGTMAFYGIGSSTYALCQLKLNKTWKFGVRGTLSKYAQTDDKTIQNKSALFLQLICNY